MHDQEPDNRRHAEEMDKPRDLKVVKQKRQLRELDRLPDRQARHHDHNALQNDADIEDLLDRVVVREVIVIETKSQRVADSCDDLGWFDRKKLFAKASSYKSIDQIDQTVDCKNPHAEEMPLQAVLRPLAKRDCLGEMQPAEDHFVVVDLPSTRDHDQHR